MVNFGLIDEWEPAPGRLTTWVATPESLARAAQAPVHPAPPSHQQEQYLQLADRHSEADFRFSGLCLVTAEIPLGDLDQEAMTRAINAFLMRHDTFRTWFSLASGGVVRRHLVDAGAVDFAPVDYGLIDDPEAIRQHVQKTTPGPLQWDCFTFGVIEHGESTTVYLAADHLHTDGLGQYLSCYDLAHLYAAEVGEEVDELPPAASYLDYCTMERGYTAQLTPASLGVRKWLELIRGNDGRLPSFPLNLGRRSDVYNRSAHRSIELLSEEEALRFEQHCRDNEAEFIGGVFAAAALAERELVGSDYYFGMTPISTRTSAPERASVGWYVTLVPVAFPVGPTTSFERAATIAQRAYENGIRLGPTTFHRVLELLPADSEIQAGPGHPNPMISYVDARDFIGSEFFGEVTGGIYANRAASEEVLIWVNRFPSGTSLSVIYPDTPVAHESVERYVAAMSAVFERALRQSAPPAPAAPTAPARSES
ncbi:condensation domain-containing protein [Nocardia sp. BMG51109]|uniref:condensation domain-containing protein n=1 Tax=Nocardia sp. BMG51109 TaxID=1056816 RepID=UPI00046439AF|nr:condensation domain-containing protein [Nocardia sp. BMG51109]